MKKILAIIITAALCMGLAGCGGSAAKPEDTVTRFCEAMKTFDFDAMDACLAGESDSGSFLEGLGEMEQLLFDRLRTCAKELRYTVGESAVSGDGAVVPVSFEFEDCTNAMTAVMDSYYDRLIEAIWANNEDISDEDAMKMFSESISDAWDGAENGTKSLSLDFSLVKTGDKWLIGDLPIELGTVLTANIEEAITGYMEYEGDEDPEGWDSGEDPEGWDTDWSDDWQDHDSYDGFGEMTAERVGIGTPITLDDYTVTFTGFRSAGSLENSEAVYEAEPGTKFVICDFTVENTSGETVNFTNEILQLFTEDGRVYSEFYDDYLFCEDYLWYSDIEPGETAKSTIVYYIPDDIPAGSGFIALYGDETVYQVYAD